MVSMWLVHSLIDAVFAILHLVIAKIIINCTILVVSVDARTHIRQIDHLFVYSIVMSLCKHEEVKEVPEAELLIA